GVQPTTEWVVLDVVNGAGISSADQVLNGRTLAVGDRLTAGDLSTGPESELEVQLGSGLRFRLLAGTSLTLPKAPGRWFNRNRQLPLTSGEIYGTSGSQKLGFDLVFNTQELEARLTGTTFAVFRTDSTSCVCLWEGGIAVTPLVGPADLVNLAEKTRVWIFRDGREPAILPLSGMETMKLQMTEDNGIAAELPPRP
ncbi:MAG: ferric-dicitrate binding protein FerR (iron transport regulator), partial [Candidatus Krumholzibacteriia bacterium]